MKSAVDSWSEQIRALIVALRGDKSAEQYGVSLSLSWVQPAAATKTTKARAGGWEWEARCCLERGTGPTADAAMVALKRALEAAIRGRIVEARARLEQLELALFTETAN
jgi:hypothetical protein